MRADSSRIPMRARVARSSQTRSAMSWRSLWLRVAIQGALVVAGVFVAYEIVEQLLLGGVSPRTLHVLHIARGVGTAFLLGTVSFLRVRAVRSAAEERLRLDMERLRRQIEDAEAERARRAREWARVRELEGDALALLR